MRDFYRVFLLATVLTLTGLVSVGSFLRESTRRSTVLTTSSFSVESHPSQAAQASAGEAQSEPKPPPPSEPKPPPPPPPLLLTSRPTPEPPMSEPPAPAAVAAPQPLPTLMGLSLIHI